MPEKLETAPAPQAFDLDRDRTASMAYEGGAAAAEMELEEELRWAAHETPRGSALAKWRATRGSWTKTLLVGALVVGAAAFLTRLALGWTRR
jgi:hypothetical protein